MKVLILGRANVGKSSLFNRLVKKKKSLVINSPGITRDLLKEKTKWWGHDFEVIDTGGLLAKKSYDELSSEILKKIKSVINEVDVLIFIVDAQTGRHPEDSDVLKMIRKTGKAFLLFVNKVDQPKKTHLLTAPFFKLSAQLLSGSFEKNYGVDEIVEWIISQKKKLSPSQKKASVSSTETSLRGIEKSLSNTETKRKVSVSETETQRKNSLSGPEAQRKNSLSKKEQKDRTQLFVIGRANSGKSLLCNQILQKNRMIVSSRSGTTLDTVTDFFSYNKEDYSISDNPGSRRGKREEREKISFAKSRTELEKADIVLLVLDALVGPSRQEARLVQLCIDKHKAVILLRNKMDLLKKLSSEEKRMQRDKLRQTFHFYPDLPIVSVSAKTGYNKDKLFKTIEDIKKGIHFRVSTSKLNKFFEKVIKKAPAPVYGTSDVKFYYINQTNRKPPEFIAFANYPKGVTPAYSRFIVNRIKKEWNLKGIPVAFHALPKR